MAFLAPIFRKIPKYPTDFTAFFLYPILTNSVIRGNMEISYFTPLSKVCCQWADFQKDSKILNTFLCSHILCRILWQVGGKKSKYGEILLTPLSSVRPTATKFSWYTAPCGDFPNLLKPMCNVMHQQFNIHKLCPLCIYVFCIYLRTNSELCHLQHKLIGFYNRAKKCLQRGTNWVFK